MGTKNLFWTGLGSVLLLSSCFSLGQSALPESPERSRFDLETCATVQQATSDSGLKIQAKQLPLQVLSTAKTPWNTHLRYVYPFTQHTVQFEVKVHNEGTQAITLAESLTLQLAGDGTAQQSLTLAFFEKAWPANAVRGAQQLHDRSMAMGEVIEHHWHQRQLFPGEHYLGWVSFPVDVLTQAPSQLQLAYDTETESLTHTLCLTPAAGRSTTP